MFSSLTQMHFVRPCVKTRAKKDDFVTPGEGPSYDEDGEPKKARVAHPIKELIKKLLKIEEIDYQKFNKENKWAIRPGQKKDKE